MSSTQEILKAAQDLGKLIAKHESAQRLDEVLQRLQKDLPAQRAMSDLNRHMTKLGEKEQSGQPIEVEDKRQLEKLQQAVVDNPILRDLQVAQMDYLDLMRRVEEAMEGPVQQSAAGGAGAAGGPQAGPGPVFGGGPIEA